MELLYNLERDFLQPFTEWSLHTLLKSFIFMSCLRFKILIHAVYSVFSNKDVWKFKPRGIPNKTTTTNPNSTRWSRVQVSNQTMPFCSLKNQLIRNSTQIKVFLMVSPTVFLFLFQPNYLPFDPLFSLEPQVDLLLAWPNRIKWVSAIFPSLDSTPTFSQTNSCKILCCLVCPVVHSTTVGPKYTPHNRTIENTAQMREQFPSYGQTPISHKQIEDYSAVSNSVLLREASWTEYNWEINF